MKIAHIIGSFSLPRDPTSAGSSGVVKAALEISKAQARRHHDITIIAVGNDTWVERWEGITLVQLRRWPWARLRVGTRTLDFATHLPLVSYLRRHRFDVIQGHLYYYLRFLPARVRVAHFHADPFYGAEADSAVSAKASDLAMVNATSDAQVAVSAYIGDQLTRREAGCTNVHVVRNGVDHDQFSGSESSLRDDLGIARDAVVFLYVGAIVPEKGVVHLARAFARLATHAVEPHLVIVGSASLWDMSTGIDVAGHRYEADVIRALAPLQREGRVHALGKVSAAAIPAIYAASDVVVIPSVWPEPFPLVALEALAAAKPVIASSVGGLPESITPSCGILVPPGDDDRLAHAMEDLATDPSLRAELGANARVASRRFSWHTAAAELDAVYAGVLAGKA